MVSDSANERPNHRDALVRAVEEYPISAFSEDSGSIKHDADAKLLRAVRAFLFGTDWNKFLHPQCFSKPMFDEMELIAVKRQSKTTGKLLIRFPAQGEYANAFQTFSGGAQATAHDYFTGMALAMIMKPGFWLSLGVSLSLNMTFVQPAHVGDILLLESEILQAGPRNAILKGTLQREKDGAIVSVSEQVRTNVDKLPSKI